MGYSPRAFQPALIHAEIPKPLALPPPGVSSFGALPSRVVRLAFSVGSREISAPCPRRRAGRLRRGRSPRACARSPEHFLAGDVGRGAAILGNLPPAHPLARAVSMSTKAVARRVVTCGHVGRRWGYLEQESSGISSVVLETVRPFIKRCCEASAPYPAILHPTNSIDRSGCIQLGEPETNAHQFRWRLSPRRCSHG